MTKFTDCLDPGFGHENGDGYVRICNIPRPQGGKLVMRHRWFWELSNGPIPSGMEIDHMCKNRRCCNIDHLQLLDGSYHASKTNADRYANIKELGMFMLELGASKADVSTATGRSVAAINNWLREANA